MWRQLPWTQLGRPGLYCWWWPYTADGLSSCRSMCLDSVYRSTKFLLANAFAQKKGFNLKTFEQFFSPSQKCKFRPCVRLAKVISLNYKWTNGLNPGRRRMYLSVWGRGWGGGCGLGETLILRADWDSCRCLFASSPSNNPYPNHANTCRHQ